MKEYWVNVYDGGYVGNSHATRQIAIEKVTRCYKCVGRLHVKLKEQKLNYDETFLKANRMRI